MTKTTSQRILDEVKRNGQFTKSRAKRLFRGLSERELHSNVMRVARHMSDKGYLYNHGGFFTLTPRGRKVLG